MEAAEACLKHVYSELPDYGVLLPAMIEGGENWMTLLPSRCHLTPGVPVSRMITSCFFLSGC